MKKKVNKALTYLIILLLLPVLFTILYQKMQLEELVEQLPTQEENSPYSREVAMIVANEIEIDAPAETIKAQIVLARTNLFAAMEQEMEYPEAANIEELEQRWGEDYEANYKKLMSLVSETGNQTLTYEDQYIYGAYHAISAGKTRDIFELYENAQMPYLTSVDCHEDAGEKDYIGVYFFSEEEFLQKCREKYPEAMIEKAEDVKIMKTDSNQYVLEVQIGNVTDTGEGFRDKMSLKSSCYIMESIDGDVRIVTHGLGHGLGMSQATAKKMAADGKTYIDILNYFFKDAKITE